MKRLRMLSLTLLVSSSVIAGKAQSKVNPENTLLWEVSGMDITVPSYIYGTMHIVCAEDARLSDTLKACIAKCKRIMFELDMDNMGEMMGILKYARMNNGEKITDFITPEEYQRVEKYFTEHSTPIPFAMMARFKPYFVTAMVAETLIKCKEKSSIEQLIMAEAKKMEKEIQGLESLEFQASIFDSVPYEKQARDLVNYIDSIGQYGQVMLDLAQLYRKQDIHAMDSLMTRSDPGMEQYMDLLLFDRNKRWSIQIPGYAAEAPTLFAVGAGHLGGDKGVINLLRKMGYTVRPLKNKL